MSPLLTFAAGAYDWRLLALAGAICFLASIATILSRRACTMQGRARAIWILTAGISIGCAIVAAHSIDLLSYDTGGAIAGVTAIFAISMVVAMVDQRFGARSAHLDAALHNICQGLVIFDSSTRIVFCNQRYIDMYNLSAEVVKPGCTLDGLIRHRKDAGLLTGDPAEYRRKILDSVASGNRTIWLIETSDGRSIHAVNHPLSDGGWVVTHEDVTERRQAEKERDRTRAFLDTVIENAPATIVVKDARDNRYLLVNREGEKFFGRSSEEMIGKNAYDFFAQDDADMITARDNEALESAEQLRHENTPMYMPNKGMRLMTTQRVTVRDDHGEPQYLVAFLDDVTERKQAEEALRDSEQMARGIIDTALDAFVQIDETGKIIEWNPQAEAVFGWSRKEAIGQVLAEMIIPAESRERHETGLARFLPAGEGAVLGKRLQLDAIRRDGTQIKIELALTGLRRRGAYVFNGFIRDITEKLATEARFRQAQKMEAVGQLTGGIAHDFNNMLTVIIGTAEILAEDVADKPQVAATVKMIEEAAQRGAELTERLLAFARKQPLQPQETDINALMTQSSKLLRRSLRENVTIETRLADDTWPALVDPGQLGTALLNLALNGRDAMPEGGKLTLETENVVIHDGGDRAHNDVPPGQYVTIAITDTGTGIPAAIRDQVFEPFFTTKGIGKGTGLGLSMVYGFVKQSGGYAKLISEVGQGTTVRLYLPRSGGEIDKRANEQQLTMAQRGTETILLVEDDELVRRQVIAQVQALGYTTITAANAAEALALLDRGAVPDLLFTDIIMPGGVNGRQLAEEAVKRHPTMKVLYTSGYTENAMTHEGRLEAGVLLLKKPYRKADLARSLRMALGPRPGADASKAAPAKQRALAKRV
jgi:PAS domain S-box-containing protein